MRISLSISNFSWPVLSTGLRETVRAADANEIDTVWVVDHLLQADPTLPPDHREILEAYTTLGFLAAHSERVRVGTMVAGVTFREPALLVKAVTTLDVLSGGRAWLGLGAGHHVEEADAMGLSMPPNPERFDRLEETLRIALRMWEGDDEPFEGTHYRLGRPENLPNSITRPHPPILIGGTGEKRTLPLVAKYADACNVFDIPDEGRTIRRKLAVLKDLCDEIGRPYDAIEKTVATRLNPGENAGAFAERLSTLRSYGLDHVAVITPEPWTVDAIETLGRAATLAAS